MSYIATLMQPLRADYPNGFDKNESRAPNVGAWDSYVRNTPLLMTEDLRQKIKLSDPARGVSIPAIDATPQDDISIRNVRSCTVPFDDGTSRLIQVTFETLVFSIQMTPADFMNNEIGYQSAFNRKYEEKAFKVMRILDSRAVANLEANKNTYWAGIDPEFYTQVGDSLQIPSATNDDFYNNLSSIWGTMDYNAANIDVIATWTHQPIVNRYRNQGAGNQTNLQFQFGPYRYYETNRITNTVQSTLYSMQPGNVAVETRVDLDARMNTRINETKYWETTMLPILDVEGGVYYDKECADRSSIQPSLTRSAVESFEFSFDITYLNTLVSDPTTQYAPILKAEFLA